MNKKTEKLINDIVGDCRMTVRQWVVENWRRAIGDPMDTYVTYGKYRDDIKRLCNEGYKAELFAALEKAVEGLEDEYVVPEECECLRCSYKWTPKKINPKQCPYCHSMKWNVPKSE